MKAFMAVLLVSGAGPAAAPVLPDYGDGYDVETALAAYLPHCVSAMVAIHHGRPPNPLPPNWTLPQRRRAAELCTMFLMGGMARDELMQAELRKGIEI